MNETARLHPEVAEFAATVRQRLDDLDAAEIEELTGDLEADLQERLEETGADLGNPDSYASELRAAAGLAPRVADAPTGTGVERFTSAAADRFHRVESRLRSGPTSGAVLDFGIALRPVWWVLRAWVVFEVVHLFVNTGTVGAVLPDSPREWLFLVIAIVVSVQWGRGVWFPWTWARRVLIAGSAVAVLALPFAIDHATERSDLGRTIPVSAVPRPPHGLALNGRPVRNVFAFDAQGKPVGDVQLFDDRGKPLNLSSAWRRAWRSIAVPQMLRSGRELWNVFPLARVPRRDTVRDPAGRGRIPGPGVEVERPQPPFTRVPALESAPTDGGNQSNSDASDERQGGDKPAQGTQSHQ